MSININELSFQQRAAWVGMNSAVDRLNSGDLDGAAEAVANVMNDVEASCVRSITVLNRAKSVRVSGAAPAEVGRVSQALADAFGISTQTAYAAITGVFR
ncbi:hypothetical protein [Paenirhodobacter populi]|uniref:Uncharacterized protein n=1 Tax=Paenirhodobacter populi TaxID=2306993 RepID=A0A443J020_9RHOB|nr:hypothetical protein [Sinirhodobacter populi]RWR13811.1 hypothetical protein D2T33_05280 [Sinirhodobacter populi]